MSTCKGVQKKVGEKPGTQKKQWHQRRKWHQRWKSISAFSSAYEIKYVKGQDNNKKGSRHW